MKIYDFVPFTVGPKVLRNVDVGPCRLTYANNSDDLWYGLVRHSSQRDPIAYLYSASEEDIRQAGLSVIEKRLKHDMQEIAHAQEVLRSLRQETGVRK